MQTHPKIVILAGPNGAGKTTFAREFLPAEAHCPTFINADLIAAGLSPFQPELAAVKAGKLMLQMIREKVAQQQNFAFETTLAGLGYARQIPLWQKQDYRVELFFISLSSPELAIKRVTSRVEQGGHSIPITTIKRRFHAGLDNFKQVYQPLVDNWILYDNSNSKPQLIEWFEKNE